jgi:hypothetical protein
VLVLVLDEKEELLAASFLPLMCPCLVFLEPFCSTLETMSPFDCPLPRELLLAFVPF